MGPTGLTGALPSAGFWRGRRVLLTGHTGFKGAWLTLWLHALGAEVTGFASPPEPGCLADIAGTGQLARSIHGDVRDPAALAAAFTAAQPSVVLHLAAQALVRRSYADPVGTFATNVIGLVHLLEAARATPGLRAVVIVTSDKCYAPSLGPHRETDALGGDDPYSASKAAAELVAAAWRAGFGMAKPRHRPGRQRDRRWGRRTGPAGARLHARLADRCQRAHPQPRRDPALAARARPALRLPAARGTPGSGPGLRRRLEFRRAPG